MTLLHEYQNGTAYRREAMPARDPHWQRRVELYKSYAGSGATVVALDRPQTLPQADLWECLRSRRSRRRFTADSLTQESLMLLLWAAQGITQPGQWAFRTAPSAGALYPVETYVAAARVDGLAKGVYHWELPEERIALVEPRDDVAAAAAAACLGQEMVAQAAVTFIWSAVWGRSAQKYGDRALRYAYLDAGHAAENLHLAVEALGLGTCMIGAFLDDAMNALVGVDGEGESVLYAACVGSPA
jgi:SagB-type dehydrogenase family enzyme